MKRIYGAAIICSLIVLGLEATGVPARAVVPGTNGRILFTRTICTSDSDPCWEIVVADSDDTHETVVAGPYPRSVWDDHFIANWSPDGTKIIFMADLGSGQAIWQVNPDGSNLHTLWSPPDDGTGIDDGPAYTPDGRSIIFTRCCPKPSGYGLWRMNADGTHLRIVTTEPVPPNRDGPSDNLPQVSPDGRTIAFHRNLNSCECYIATVNFAGGNLRGLTDLSINAQIPNWSPDSERIVFQMFPPEGGAEVGIVNADGTGFAQLTFGNGSIVSLNPSFSPDGTRIIFGRGPATGGSRDLFTMNPAGSDVVQLTHTAADERFPQWAPAT